MHPRKSIFLCQLTLATTIAALLGGLPASAQVYSQNSAGYVNLTFRSGTNLFANPLNNGWEGNLVPALLHGVPDGTVLYKFGNQGWVVNGYSELFGWDDPVMTLLPGEGALLVLPRGPLVTVTFVGEVLQGHLVNSLPAGYSLKSSMAPQAGKLQTDLKFPAVNGDTIYLYDASAQAYTRYNRLEKGWAPIEPILEVGQGFCLSNHPSVTDWAQDSMVSGGGGGSLRVSDGPRTIQIPLETPGPGGTLTSPLRIAKNGTSYGIPLVDTSAPEASPIRIKTPSGIKALSAAIPGLSLITQVKKNADGTLTLQWLGGGTLQAASSLSPPVLWQDVTGATSPYTFTPTAATMFTRIRM